MQQKSFALIGPGRVGTALAYLLTQAGYTLKTVVGRSPHSLERARHFLVESAICKSSANGVANFTLNLADMQPAVDFFLIGVKDSEIAGVVSTLQASNRLLPGQVIIHLSGVLPSDTGSALKMTNIGQLALHPLQAVADVETGITALREAVWTLEGDQSGQALGEELLTALGVRWLKIAKEDKPLYHAAACIVSNYLVTLVATGIAMLTRIGFTPELAGEALLPLIQGTVANLAEKSPRDALTGPIARGDVQTVAKHLAALECEPAWQDLYGALGLATLQYASLTEESREAFGNLLAKEESA